MWASTDLAAIARAIQIAAERAGRRAAQAGETRSDRWIPGSPADDRIGRAGRPAQLVAVLVALVHHRGSYSVILGNRTPMFQSPRRMRGSLDGADRARLSATDRPVEFRFENLGSWARLDDGDIFQGL